MVPDVKRTNSGWLNGKRGHGAPASPSDELVHISASLVTGTGMSGGISPSSSATTAVSVGNPRASAVVRSAESRRLANSTVGRSCSKRLRIAGTPMSAPAPEKVAPSAVVASPAITASALFPATAAARSPVRSPMRSRPAAALRTRSRSSRRLSRSGGPDAWQATSALSFGSPARRRFST